MLGIKVGEVGDQILDNFHMWQRIDFNVALNFGQAMQTGQGINPTNIHCTRAADAFSARPAECQCWINLVFNFYQRIQDHWATGIHIDKIGIDLRILAIIGVPPIDAKFAQIDCAFWLWPGFSNRHTAVFRQGELYHGIS